MNLISDHDGFETNNRSGTHCLYLVEGDGAKYTLLATFQSVEARDLFWEYLSRRSDWYRPSNDNLPTFFWEDER
jgi:hypothetical protein